MKKRRRRKRLKRRNKGGLFAALEGAGILALEEYEEERVEEA